MEDKNYKKLEKVLDEVIEVPFSIFYDKMIYDNNIVLDRQECFMLWIQLNGYARNAIFKAISSGFFTPFKDGKEAINYLKSFTKK